MVMRIPNNNRNDMQKFVQASGLSISERAAIRKAIQGLHAILAQDGTDPVVAYTALLNVLGALIAGPLGLERAAYEQRAVQLLPLYVEAYLERELRLPPSAS